MHNIDATKAEPVGPVRAVAPVSPIQPVAQSPSLASQQDGGRFGGGDKSHAQAASAAEYMRASARMLGIMADLSASRTPGAGGERQILDLMPRPIVIIPLPPASADMVLQAIETAQQMARNVVMTHAAQANVNPGTVDQVLASAS